MKKIDVSTKNNTNKFTLVDSELFHELNKHKWHIVTSRGSSLSVVRNQKKCDGYTSGRRDTIIMSRVIMNAKKWQIVDHINGDQIDNRKVNLRICNVSQNAMNQKIQLRHKSSRYKGVYFCKKLKKYVSRIVLNKKRFSLGCYFEEKDAALAYDKKANELHGEFARLNFQNETVTIIKETNND